MTAHHAAAWTVRARVEDLVSSARSALADWLSSILRTLALGEDHDFSPVPASTPVDADRRPGESGSQAASVVAILPAGIATTFPPRSSLEHVNWGR